jgi:hypothetical protein
MKFTTRLPLALLLAISFCAAQAPVREPEFADVFFRLENGQLTALEREPITMKGGAHGFIVMNVKVTARFPGGNSTVRFKAGEPLDFVVRSPFAAGAADPATLYILRKLDAKKDHREVTFTGGRFTPLGGSTSTNFQEGTLPVTFSKYGKASYQVNNPGLPPGEYALGSIYPRVLFAFGVDGPTK